MYRLNLVETFCLKMTPVTSEIASFLPKFMKRDIFSSKSKYWKFLCRNLLGNKPFSTKKGHSAQKQKKKQAKMQNFESKSAILLEIPGEISKLSNFGLKINQRLFLLQNFLRNLPFFIKKGPLSSNMNKNSRSKMTRKLKEILIFCIKFLEMTIFDRN